MNSSRLVKRIARHALMAVAVLLLAGVFASVATACPTCSQALADEQQGDADIVAGYFWSIIFMMSMPFILLSSFSGYMYLEVKKARASQAAADETRVPANAGPSLSRDPGPLVDGAKTTSSAKTTSAQQAVSFDQPMVEPAEVAG